MKIIAITGQKGGTGKSTLAQTLAVAFSQDDFSTLGIDLDPQCTFASWYDRREADAPQVKDSLYGRLTRNLENAKAQGAEVCIIDTAGRAEAAATTAIQAADLVIVTTQPSAADLLTVKASRDQIKNNGDPKAFALLTRVKPHGTSAEEAQRFLEKVGMITCPHVIGDRVAYQYAMPLGLAPQEYEPSGKAADECRHVYMFTKQQLGL